MLSGKIRPVIAIEGTPVIARVVPHKTDATKLVLKSPIPEGGVALASLLGIEVEGEITRGRCFFMVTVDKAKFLAALGAGVAKALEVAVPTADPKPELEVLEGGKCAECGCDDGTHWAFCSDHGENKSLN